MVVLWCAINWTGKRPSLTVWRYHDFYARLGRLGRVGLVVVWVVGRVVCGSWVVWVYARLGRVGLVVVFRFWKVGVGIVWGFCGGSR